MPINVKIIYIYNNYIIVGIIARINNYVIVKINNDEI